MCEQAADFNPRSPHGERPARWRTSCGARRFQPTLPARGATSLPPPESAQCVSISTHAPRTGSDAEYLSTIAHRSISTHAPRTGSDGEPMISLFGAFVFQPTLPARGATRCLDCGYIGELDFNPRSPHGERHNGDDEPCVRAHFNPRSPHGERRRDATDNNAADNFNPRSPHGERPLSPFHKRTVQPFQPTLPARGATNQQLVLDNNCCSFQPTLPARGATCTAPGLPRAGDISTHAPRTGSDEIVSAFDVGQTPFQPTLPARGATGRRERPKTAKKISTHAPRTGSDGLS